MAKSILLWFLLLSTALLKAQTDSTINPAFISKSSHSVGMDIDFSSLTSFDINYRFQRNNNNIVFGFQRFNGDYEEGESYIQWNDSVVEKRILYVENLFNNFYLGYQFRKPIKPHFQFYCGAYAMLGWQQSRLDITNEYFPLHSEFSSFGEADSTGYTQGNFKNNLSYGLYSNVGLEFMINPFLSVNAELANRLFYNDNLAGKGYDKYDLQMSFNAGVRFYFSRKN